LVWKSRAVLACAICFLLNYANHEADTLMTVPAAPPRSRSRSSCSRPTAGPPTSWPPRRHTRHSACGNRLWRQCPTHLITTTLAPQCWTGSGQLVSGLAMNLCNARAWPSPSSGAVSSPTEASFNGQPNAWPHSVFQRRRSHCTPSTKRQCLYPVTTLKVS
jgi:hypothetical protein